MGDKSNLNYSTILESPVKASYKGIQEWCFTGMLQIHLLEIFDAERA